MKKEESSKDVKKRKPKGRFKLDDLLKDIKEEDVIAIKEELKDFINSPPVGKELI